MRKKINHDVKEALGNRPVLLAFCRNCLNEMTKSTAAKIAKRKDFCFLAIDLIRDLCYNVIVCKLLISEWISRIIPWLKNEITLMRERNGEMAMNKMNIPFSPPDISEAEIQEVGMDV